MRKTTSGFTIVEILVVISIIGILTAIGFASYSSIQSGTRDHERSSQITIISEALEKYYDQNGEYPSCTAMIDTPGNIVKNTLKGLDPAVFTAPNSTSGTNSISCSDLASGSNNFAYIGDGSSACLTDNIACLQYTLKYNEESSGAPRQVNSRRTASIASGAVVAPSTPTITAAIDGNGHIVATVAPVTCTNAPTEEYGISSRINNDNWTGYSDWSSTILTKDLGIPAQGNKYTFKVQARCKVNNFSYSTNTLDAIDAVYTQQIAYTPPQITEFNITTPNYYTVNFSWDQSLAQCPTGTTSNYNYKLSVGSTLIHDWVEPSSIPVSITMAYPGLTYSIQEKARCVSNFDNSVVSAWSPDSVIASYTRSVPHINVLLAGGGGGGGYNNGGGGGGGGVVYSNEIATAGSYSVVVGDGGVGETSSNPSGGTGKNSTFINASANINIVARGGGGGGSSGSGGLNGGSGGGGAGNSSGDSAFGVGVKGSLLGNGIGYVQNGGNGGHRAPEGYSGADAGGGGGGASQVGGSMSSASPGKQNGGSGIIISAINNTPYGGGGGGGGGDSGYYGTGGSGGGGDGGSTGGPNPNSGAVNTGGGGGGGKQGGNGASGGKGIVIFRYTTGSMGVSGGDSSQVVGLDTIVIFYNSGTLQIY